MKKNIPLMLDSTVLKQVPKLNSELFNELVKCTRADLYSLFISEIVEKEYISWVRIEAQNAYDTVAKVTRSLDKFYENPSILGFDLVFDATTFAAKGQINGILKKVTDNWLAFKERTGATILPIQPEHGKMVMDAYFNGEKPFGGIKKRSDIPDSFIFCSLNELLKSNEKVIFVSSDKRLCKSICSEKIICFDSLTDLFSEGPARLDSRFFLSLDSNNKFHALVRIYEDEIQRKLVREIEFADLSDIFGVEAIEVSLGDYTDISTEVIEIWKKFDKARNISELSYLIPFEAKVKCVIESLATKDEVLTINDERLKNIDKEVDDNGDFKISESHFYCVSGHFSLKFDSSDPSIWREQEKVVAFWKEKEIKEITIVLEDIQENA